MRDAFMRALIAQESGGDPNARNARTGAFGMGQIMPENWGPWAGQYLGDPNAMQTPENQETVVRGKLNEYFDKFQDPKLVASAWYAGPGYAESLQAGKPLFDPNAPQGGGNEPSVNEYSNQVLSRMGIQSGVAGAGGPLGPGTSGMTDRSSTPMQPSGPQMAFMNFLQQGQSGGNFDPSILKEFEDSMRPSTHRQQAMQSFMSSMAELAKTASTLYNPDAIKEAMGSMAQMNQINMGFADAMEKEEQTRKRMKIGLSALNKMGEPGANQEAYGNVFQLATGQKPYESPNRISPKDMLNASLAIQSANRTNKYYDLLSQQLEQNMAFNRQKATMKQQPTLTDRKDFLEELGKVKEMIGDKGPMFDNFVRNDLPSYIELGKQLGFNPTQVAGVFGQNVKARA